MWVNILIGIGAALIVVGVIVKMIIDKKKGKTSCCGDCTKCSCCPSEKDKKQN